MVAGGFETGTPVPSDDDQIMLASHAAQQMWPPAIY